MDLKRWLKIQKISITDAAKDLGVSRAHLSMVANKHTPAGRVLGTKIKKLTLGAVTLDDVCWDDPE